MATPKKYYFTPENDLEDEDTFLSRIGKSYRSKYPAPIPESPEPADESPPGITPIAPTASEQRMTEGQGQGQKKGIGDQLRDFFIGPKYESQKDEYGIEKPHPKQRSVAEGILNLALPALYSLASGEGIAPGLMTGLAGQKGGDIQSLKEDTERYRTEANTASNRASQQALKQYRDELSQYRLKNLAEKERYHDTMGGAAQQRAGAYTERVRQQGESPPKSNDRDRYIDIGNRLKQGKEISPGELDWYEKQAQIYQKRGTVSSGKFDPNELKQLLRGK